MRDANQPVAAILPPLSNEPQNDLAEPPDRRPPAPGNVGARQQGSLIALPEAKSVIYILHYESVA
jgi:hypothetical protein